MRKFLRRTLQLFDQFLIRRETRIGIRREHPIDDAACFARNLWRDRAQLDRLILQLAQLARGICFFLDWRPTGESVKQSPAQTVNVAAEIFRFVV